MKVLSFEPNLLSNISQFKKDGSSTLGNSFPCTIKFLMQQTSNDFTLYFNYN